MEIERLHSALGLLYGRWTLVAVSSGQPARVTDGERVGYRYRHELHVRKLRLLRPLNGVIYLVCGQRSELE
jgi:hypothetical protein